MDASAHQQYLEQQVMTASPQKLQLMLIETTIRSAEKARTAWRQEDDATACEAMIHAQSCIGELLAGLNHNEGTELVRKLAGLYMFVFRRLVDANQQRDETILDDALNVLGIERETWRQVCRRCGGGDHSDALTPPAGAPVEQAGSGIPGVALPDNDSACTWIPGTGVPSTGIADTGIADTGAGGLSLEA